MIHESDTIRDAVTGQQTCDHIVGISLSDFPQFGGIDTLAKLSESAVVEHPFKYCPLCGAYLGEQLSTN
jgi:hypothetical protein